jgi:hypothetical protein
MLLDIGAEEIFELFEEAKIPGASEGATVDLFLWSIWTRKRREPAAAEGKPI